MNLSINSFSTGVSGLKANKAPAFKGVLSYPSDIENRQRAIDVRHISAITSVDDGEREFVRITFLHEKAEPVEPETRKRHWADYVMLPYEKVVKAYAKALSTNDIVELEL